MKNINIIIASLLIWTSNIAYCKNPIMDAKKIENNSKHEGSRWFKYGAGVITSSKSIRVSFYEMQDGVLKKNKFMINDALKMTLIRSWLMKHVAPALNSRPLDEGMHAESVAFQVLLYSSANKQTKNELLMKIPISTLFSKEDIEIFKKIITEETKAKE